MVFDKPASFANPRTLLHFGAVDWQCTAYINGATVGSHTGGYDSFWFEITDYLKPTANELILYVYDPSDDGYQVNGKQRISAITDPGGDTYTPASGIWQTVWLENVPSVFVSDLKMEADAYTFKMIPTANPEQHVQVSVTVYDNGVAVASVTGTTGNYLSAKIPNPKIWCPANPFLYDLVIKLSTGDTVTSYFGMRTVSLGSVWHPGTPDTGAQIGIDRPGQDMSGYPITLDEADYNLCWALCNETAECQAWAYGIPGCDSYRNPQCWLKSGIPGTSSNPCRVSGAKGIDPFTARRPFLNGGFVYLAGWLDQSFWPDGIYTAPSDEALRYDLEALSIFGMNTVRLHQKVNSERWYYHADTLGVIVIQDMPQKYGGATAATVDPFMDDLQAMIYGKFNHPSIIQWVTFNEGDCVGVFDAASVVATVQAWDPSRLVDTNSGGPANDLHVGDVNDYHNYPYPGDPRPSSTQYGMEGEFGGIGAFITGHEWVPNQCTTYLEVDTPQEEADTYVAMADTLFDERMDVSCSIYTQITDVERECDGFLNYDRTNKFTQAQTDQIWAANQALISGTK